MSGNIMNTYTACKTSIVFIPYPVFKMGNVSDQLAQNSWYSKNMDCMIESSWHVELNEPVLSSVAHITNMIQNLQLNNLVFKSLLG